MKYVGKKMVSFGGSFNSLYYMLSDYSFYTW